MIVSKNNCQPASQEEFGVNHREIRVLAPGPPFHACGTWNRSPPAHALRVTSAKGRLGSGPERGLLSHRPICLPIFFNHETSLKNLNIQLVFKRKKALWHTGPSFLLYRPLPPAPQTLGRGPSPSPGVPQAAPVWTPRAGRVRDPSQHCHSMALWFQTRWSLTPHGVNRPLEDMGPWLWGSRVAEAQRKGETPLKRK